MIHTLYKVFPESELAQLNKVTGIPDVGKYKDYQREIYRFYEAGILEGLDARGTFGYNKAITRAEAAAIFMRLVESSSRTSGKTFDTPALTSEFALDAPNYNITRPSDIPGGVAGAVDLSNWQDPVGEYFDEVSGTRHTQSNAMKDEVARELVVAMMRTVRLEREPGADEMFVSFSVPEFPWGFMWDMRITATSNVSGTSATQTSNITISGNYRIKMTGPAPEGTGGLGSVINANQILGVGISVTLRNVAQDISYGEGARWTSVSYRTGWGGFIDSGNMKVGEAIDGLLSWRADYDESIGGDNIAHALDLFALEPRSSYEAVLYRTETTSDDTGVRSVPVRVGEPFVYSTNIYAPGGVQAN
jgi:hypothetical protein